MSKLFVVALCALLLIGASCQKKQVENQAAGASNVAVETSAADAQPEIPAVDPNAPADEAMISQRLRDLAPQYNYRYSAENTSITGPGTPPDGVKLPVLIGEVKPKLPTDMTGVTVDQVDQVIQVVYQQMAAKAGAAVPTEEGQRPEAVFPKSVEGTWRSVREEQGTTVSVQHDDKYYEQMSITKEGRIGINTIRDGQLFAQIEFGYKYDPTTGKLTLLSDAGEVQGLLYFTTYPDHPELIYAREEGNDTVKVYENIGGVSTPQAANNGGLAPVAPKDGKK